jgi:hypothetical protein
MKKIVILISLIISGGNIIAQNSSISQYLDDGGRASATNILKTDPILIYQGTVPFIWEHLFGDNFSLEMGAGVVLPFYNRPLVYLGSFGQNSLTSPHLGGSLYLSPKYLFGRGLESFYTALPLTLRWYPQQLALFNGGLVLGYQWLFNSRLTIDVSFGFGVMSQFSLNKKSYVFDAEDRWDYPADSGIVGLPNSYPDVTHVTIPVSIKFGYRL